MDVQVVDGLATVFAGVDDQAIAFAEAFVAGDLGCGPEQAAEQGAVRSLGLRSGGDVPARHDENVHRRLRVQVGEGVGLLIFEDWLGGNLAGDDFTKQAIHGEISVHCGD